MVEKGLARPGMLIVGSDSHTCMYGALGVFAAGIDRTEAVGLDPHRRDVAEGPREHPHRLVGRLPPA